MLRKLFGRYWIKCEVHCMLRKFENVTCALMFNEGKFCYERKYEFFSILNLGIGFILYTDMKIHKNE